MHTNQMTDVMATKLESAMALHNFDFTANERTKKVIRVTWTNLVNGTTAATTNSNIEALCSKWIQIILDHHSECTRHYHTLVHLQEMIEYFQPFVFKSNSTSTEEGKRQSEQQEYQNSRRSADDASLVGPKSCHLNVTITFQYIILYSILFHDIIYDARSSQNEENSAKLFQQCATELHLSNNITTQVVDFILATKTHQSSSSSSVLHDDDKNTKEQQYALALFLDLDMAVLGKRPDAYNKYAILIRKEYQHVPHDTYCSARADILSNFLSSSSPSVFATSPFQQSILGSSARTNLQNEILLLRKNEIPS